jgi:hypothetical protein
MVDKPGLERRTNRNELFYRHRVLHSPRIFAIKGILDHVARKFAQRDGARTRRENEKATVIELLAPEWIAQLGIKKYRV